MLTIENRINPTQQHIDNFVELEGGLIAHRYNIIATSAIAYSVYERSSFSGMTHSSFISNKAYGVLGDITTRHLTPELDALPAWSNERSTAVKAFHRELEAKAERCIRKAFPKDFEDRS